MSQTEPANIYLWVGGYTGSTGPHTGWTNGGIASSKGYWVNWADGSTTDKGDFSYSPYCWNFPENWVLYHPPVIASDNGNDTNTISTEGIYPGFSRATTIPGARDRAIFDANVSGIIKDITLYADTRTGIRSDIGQAWKNKFKGPPAGGWYAFATAPYTYGSETNVNSYPGGLFVPYAFPYRISCLFGGASGDGYTHGTNPNPEHYQRTINSTALLAQQLGLHGQEGHDDMNIFYEGRHEHVKMLDAFATERKYHFFTEGTGQAYSKPSPFEADSKFDGRGNNNTYYAPLESIRIGYAYRKNGIGAGSNVYYASNTPQSLLPHQMVPLPKSGWAGIGVCTPVAFPSVFNRLGCSPTYAPVGTSIPPNWPGHQGNGSNPEIPPYLRRSSACGPKVYPNGVPGWHKPGATLGSGSDLIQFVTPDLPKHPLGFRQGEIGVPLPTNYNKNWNMSTGWDVSSTGGNIDGENGVIFEGSTAAFYQNSQSWFKTHIPGIPLRVRADEIVVNDHAWRNGYTANSLNDGANINIHALPLDSRYLGGTAGANSTNWNTKNVVGTRFLSTSNFQTAVRCPVWWQWTSWGMLGGAGNYSPSVPPPTEGKPSDWYSLRQLYMLMTSGGASTVTQGGNKCDVLPPLGEHGGPTGPWLSSGSHQFLLSGYWGEINHKSGYLSVIGATASVATGITSTYIKNYESGININTSTIVDASPVGDTDFAESIFEYYGRLQPTNYPEWDTKRNLLFYYPYTALGTTGTMSAAPVPAGFPANCRGAFISNTNFGHLNIGVLDGRQSQTIEQILRCRPHLIRDGVKVIDGSRTLFANENGKFVKDRVSSDGIQVSGWETMSPSNCLMIGTFNNNYNNKPVYARNFATLEANLNMTAQSENVGADDNISLNMRYNMGPIVRMGGNFYVEEIRANGGYIGVHPNASGPISILDGYVEGPTLLDLNYKSNSSSFGLTSSRDVLILGNSSTEGTGIKVINTNIPSNWQGTTGAPVMNSADENVSIYGYGSIACDSVRLAEGKVRIIPDSYNAYRIRDEIKGATAAAHYYRPI